MTDPRIEAAIDAILKARAWRDPVWGDSAIGGFDYSTKEAGPRYVIRDHEAERREQKTVILHATADREEYEREHRRAVLRREIVAMLPAMDTAAWRPIETAPRDVYILTYYADGRVVQDQYPYRGMFYWAEQYDDAPLYWMPPPRPPERE